MKIKSRFSPENTFLNGQCFRWNPKDSGFEGIVGGRVYRLKKEGEDLHLMDLKEEELPGFLHYLGFEEGLEEKERQIAAIDPLMAAAVSHGQGMHLLRQEPFETLISFILSANNHIPRIKRLVDKLARSYGFSLEEEMFSFPGPEELARASLAELRALGLGYRDAYVLDAAQRVAEGKTDLDELYKKDGIEAMAELEKIKGVGKKVASCVMLFAYGKRDHFPVDTWIKKALLTYYPQEILRYPNVDSFLRDYFGKDSGLAQQYLFHYMRTGKKD